MVVADQPCFQPVLPQDRKHGTSLNLKLILLIFQYLRCRLILKLGDGRTDHAIFHRGDVSEVYLNLVVRHFALLLNFLRDVNGNSLQITEERSNLLYWDVLFLLRIYQPPESIFKLRVGRVLAKYMREN